jgi:hypothetical protein
MQQITQQVATNALSQFVALSHMPFRRAPVNTNVHITSLSAGWTQLLSSDILEHICMCCSWLDAQREQQDFCDSLFGREKGKPVDEFMNLSPITLLESRTWVEVSFLLAAVTLFSCLSPAVLQRNSVVARSLTCACARECNPPVMSCARIHTIMIAARLQRALGKH